MLKNPQIVLKQLSNPSRDERGITLQTLIVTAVLVLMAVAAGVVVVAITNNASDDLSEQSPTWKPSALRGNSTILNEKL